MVTPWPAPYPLEGVKSKKKPIFEVADAELPCTGSNGLRKASGLRLCLSSRVAAIGEGGCAAIALLSSEVVPLSGNVSSHEALKVARLGPQSLAPARQAGSSYLDAIEAAMQDRPQVVVLEEALAQQDRDWTIAFRSILCSEALKAFRGAVVVSVADETHDLGGLCLESWVAVGAQLQSEPYLEFIGNALEGGDRAQELMAEALAIEYCHLKGWIDQAEEKGQQVTLLSSLGEDGRRSLHGFLCHHMIESKAEFHIRFVFVPKEHRRKGLGARMVQWAIAKANRLPQAECRWISLIAADGSLVPWYEKFGFCDMSYSCNEEDEVWMELRNNTLGPGE